MTLALLWRTWSWVATGMHTHSVRLMIRLHVIVVCRPLIMKTVRPHQLRRMLPAPYAGDEAAAAVLEPLVEYGLGESSLRIWIRALFQVQNMQDTRLATRNGFQCIYNTPCSLSH